MLRHFGVLQAFDDPDLAHRPDLGIAGVIRSTSSENVTRSWVKSTAGGIDVIDAAAISTAKPMPISTSTKRRTRARAVPPAAIRRTARKLAKPSSSNIPSRTLFV